MNVLSAVSPYVGLNILLIIYLAYGVIKIRIANKIPIGDAGNPDLLRAIRAHGNATEYMALAMIGLVVMASTGQPAWAVHFGGLVFTIGRVMHAIGFSKPNTSNPIRRLGMMATLIALLWIAIFCLLGTFS